MKTTENRNVSPAPLSEKCCDVDRAGRRMQLNGFDSYECVKW